MHATPRMRRFLIGLACGLFLFLGIVAYGFQYYNSAGPNTEEITLLFKKGTGFEEIVDQMSEAGVIRHRFALEKYQARPEIDRVLEALRKDAGR